MVQDIQSVPYEDIPEVLAKCPCNIATINRFRLNVVRFWILSIFSLVILKLSHFCSHTLHSIQKVAIHDLMYCLLLFTSSPLYFVKLKTPKRFETVKRWKLNKGINPASPVLVEGESFEMDDEVLRERERERQREGDKRDKEKGRETERV